MSKHVKTLRNRISSPDDRITGSMANMICIDTLIKFMNTFLTLHVSLSLGTMVTMMILRRVPS